MGKSTAISKVTRWIMTGKCRPEDNLPPDLQERIKNLGVDHALAECCRKVRLTLPFDPRPPQMMP